MTSNQNKPIIGIIGGTGKEGFGLTYRWVKSGYKVIIGSRSIEKANKKADEIKALLAIDQVQGTTYEQAAIESDIVVITIPFSTHIDILTKLKPHLKDKLVIDVTVPLVPPKVSVVQMPPDGSSAQEALRILGTSVQLATAFQNISHVNLSPESDSPTCDVLVTGTSADARSTTLSLVESAGFTGWDAGPIENSAVVEGLTSVLIWINKKYGSSHAGIRITGIENPD